MVLLSVLARSWTNDDGQDIAEYTVMLAVILVIVVAFQRSTVFSQTANSVSSKQPFNSGLR